MITSKDIGEGLYRVTMSDFDPTRDFKAKEYRYNFKGFIDLNRSFFDTLVTYFKENKDRSDEESDREFTEAAQVFSEAVKKEIDKISFKPKRGLELSVYNMLIVAYVFPAVNYVAATESTEVDAELLTDYTGKDEKAAPVADGPLSPRAMRLCEITVKVWNSTFAKTNISTATYDEIASGFRKKRTFFTRA